MFNKICNKTAIIVFILIFCAVKGFCGANLALDKPVEVSSKMGAGSNLPAEAIDGNSGTRWESVYTDEQWLKVDLGQKYTINSATITWESAYATHYQLRVSTDDTNWTVVFSTDDANGVTDAIVFSDTEARYVVMYATHRATSYGYSIFEFAISGGGENLALNGTATASSAVGDLVTGPVDGNLYTSWESEHSDPQWIYVNLESTYTINGVILRWETAYGKEFSIQVSSNSADWTTVAVASDASTTIYAGGRDNVFNLTPVDAHYVRAYLTERGTEWGYKLYEFEVYSDTTAPAAITDLSALPGNGENEILLDWTAPGDDGSSGDITGGWYEIRYSTSPSMESYYQNVVTTSTSPGTHQFYAITGLISKATYYMRVRTSDNINNWSGLSDAATTWAQASVDVVKSTDVSSVLPGGVIQYTINLRSERIDTVNDFYIQEKIPFNTSLTANSGDITDEGASVLYWYNSQWYSAWSQSATAIRWTWSTLAPTAEKTVTYKVQVDGGAGAGPTSVITLDDFDNGSELNEFGTMLFGTAYPTFDDLGYWVSYSTAIKIGPSGKAAKFQWWIPLSTLTVKTGLLFSSSYPLVDFSSYTYVSFWIYTPSPGANATAVFEDDDGTQAKIRLSELMYTEPVWYHVNIPLARIQRANPDINLEELKYFYFLAGSGALEYESEGHILIDDFKFVKTNQAPAGSWIISGGDEGVAKSLDMPGDTVIYYNETSSTKTCNSVSVLVSTGYSVQWASTPSLLPDVNYAHFRGAMSYFSYSLCNNGNSGIPTVFTSELVSGNWDIRNYWDKDESEGFSSGDAEYGSTVGIIPGTTQYFLLGAFVPSTAIEGSSVTVRLTAKTQNGAGTNDLWPAAANDDTISFEVSLKLLLTDATSPQVLISTQPPTEINVPDTNVMLVFEASDPETGMKSLSVSYSLDNGTSGSNDFTLNDFNFYQYNFKDFIGGEDGLLTYTITATNNKNMTTVYTGTSIIKSEVTQSVISGEVKLEDGNPNDGYTYVSIPEGALSSQTDITIKYLKRNTAPGASGGMLSVIPCVYYEFLPDGQQFNKPVEMCLLYLDTDNDGVEDTTQLDESLLKIFLWDGFGWKFLRGSQNIVNNTITIRTTHFSKYAIFPASLGKDAYRPAERIITPSVRDGKNDYVEFPAFAYDEDYEIKIFNSDGRKVRTLKNESIWRGDDSGGRVLESGVYIYQYKANIDGKKELITGTVTIAK